MKIISVALASLISSAFFLDTAWAVPKKTNCKPPKNLSTKVYPSKGVVNVKPHVRTAPNGTKTDNLSTIGNINPHTGKKGTKRP